MAPCDLQAAQRVAAAAASLCPELSALVSSPNSPVDASALCARSPCLAALRELRTLRLGGCALRGAASLDASLDACAQAQAASLRFDTKQLSAGAAAGLGLTLLALFVCLVLVCAWVRRSRRKHPLQLLSPVRMPSRRGRGVAMSVSGIGGSVPYASIELSEEELREKARKK